MEDLIKEIKEEMNSLYGFDLSTKQIQDYLKENPEPYKMGFDTVERERLVEWIALKITGMHWPCFGNDESYKKIFYDKLYNNAEKSGFKWKK